MRTRFSRFSPLTGGSAAQPNTRSARRLSGPGFGPPSPHPCPGHTPPGEDGDHEPDLAHQDGPAEVEGGLPSDVPVLYDECPNGPGGQPESAPAAAGPLRVLTPAATGAPS